MLSPEYPRVNIDNASSSKDSVQKPEKSLETEEIESEKPPFALDGWNYSPAAVNKLVEKITVSLNEPTALISELHKALESGGGKAFGLTICDYMTGVFESSEYELNVPEWKIIDDCSTINPDDQEYLSTILRGSAPDEDWLNSASGEGQSYNFYDGAQNQLFLRDRDAGKLNDKKFVLQQAVEGFGCVVDIAYSPNQDEVVTRIAGGNRRGRKFTSATNDSEASVGIWSSINGNPITPTIAFPTVESLFDNNQKIQKDLSRDLFEAIKKLGIDFGVQLELIINPGEKSIYLVQIRPTPHQVFKNIKGMEFKKQPHSFDMEFAQSPLVNGAFDYTGPLHFINHREIDAIRIDGYNMRNSNAVRPEKCNIGVYSRHSGVKIKYYNAAEIYCGAYVRGSNVQITPKPIIPNSHHGILEVSDDSDQLYNLLNDNCGMVYLPLSEIEKIQGIVNKSDKLTKARVVSDGLIAKIFLIKK